MWAASFSPMPENPIKNLSAPCVIQILKKSQMSLLPLKTIDQLRRCVQGASFPKQIEIYETLLKEETIEDLFTYISLKFLFPEPSSFASLNRILSDTLVKKDSALKCLKAILPNVIFTSKGVKFNKIFFDMLSGPGVSWEHLNTLLTSLSPDMRKAFFFSLVRSSHVHIFTLKSHIRHHSSE